MKSYFLYDGQCGMCHASVRFFMRFSKTEDFMFSTIDSEFTQNELSIRGIPLSEASEGAIYIRGEHLYQKSSAVLEALSDCVLPFSLFSIGLIIPKKLRDGLYRCIARRRLWISKKLKLSCNLPKHTDQNRFKEVR